MNKKRFCIIIVTISIAIILVGFAIGRKIHSYINEKSNENIEIIVVSEEKVTDDCIEEVEVYEISLNEQVEQVSSKEIKVSPKCTILQKRYYKGCNHTLTQYLKLQEEIVNKTKEEVEEFFQGWTIKEFDENEIIIYKEFSGNCEEHYMIRNNDGKINIYIIDEEGNEKLYKETSISTEYLTAEDLININSGIEIYSREDLNKILEDFE